MLRKNKIHTSLTPTFYLLLASPVALTSALTSWQTMERCPIPDATSACFRFPPLSFHISPDVSFLFHHNLPFNLCQACNRLPSIANKNALPEQQILQKKISVRHLHRYPPSWKNNSSYLSSHHLRMQPEHICSTASKVSKDHCFAFLLVLIKNLEVVLIKALNYRYSMLSTAERSHFSAFCCCHRMFFRYFFIPHWKLSRFSHASGIFSTSWALIIVDSLFST